MITYLIFEAIPLIEEGLGEEISVKEIEEHINQGDIIPFLQERFPFKEKKMDLSLLLEGGVDKEKPGYTKLGKVQSTS